MGTGAKPPSVAVPAAPPPVDAFGTMLQQRQAALRTAAARQGVGSTFLTGPAPVGPLGGTQSGGA